MSGKRVLITGGFGNLGSWLSEYFYNKRYSVFILSRSIKGSSYNIIKADITNIEKLRDELYMDFDYVIHTASYNEFFHENYAKKALLVNALGTRNLIEVLKDRGIKRFIYLSTFHVYGESSGVIREDTPLNPKNDYASTHLFAEYYLKQFYSNYNFPSVILRLTNSYGSPKSIDSSKWYLVLNDLAKSAFLDKKIILKSNGKAVRDFIYMGDVCKIIEKSFKFTPNSILNLSSNMTYSMLYLAKKVQLVYKQRYNKELEILINREDSSIGRDLSVDNSKLKSLIDIEFSNRFEDEISNIFDLLEQSYG
jgi:UDP-glucose 4-epimerase